jgi:hypothetical protein
MQHQLTPATHRVLRIVLIVAIACAIGIAAGRNSNNVSTIPQSRGPSFTALSP